jgi:hypothetical protein
VARMGVAAIGKRGLVGHIYACVCVCVCVCVCYMYIYTHIYMYI